MKDLLESIPSTNVKIIEIYNKIESKSLILSPDFQRKLVWKKQHKFHFIETILKNYPFPEVYIASSEMDVTTIKSCEVVVDGQQRLSTIVDYIKSQGDFKNQNKIKAFSSLNTDEKKMFLNYFISVRDLKNMDIEIIKDIFKRINNTEYSLNAIEKINAQYGDSEFIMYCKQLVDADYQPSIEDTDTTINSRERNFILQFFSESEIFSDYDVKRMNDLQFVMTLVSTLIESEYFIRNSKVTDYIEKYNSSFEPQEQITNAITRAIRIYSSLELDKTSYWLTKSNAFTLLVEFSKYELEQIDIERLQRFLLEIENNNRKYFANIEIESIPSDQVKYFGFAKEAVNARGARIYRGDFISNIIDDCITEIDQ
ncbi:DUF262 domain-containing protein [Marinobacter sp. M1N3S26]|uniref:DUF262 domain-containing protein n=1 Tax=Marinobacter sp. M1N3S26 TaxID=3382299 RepID=UPI00387B52F2